MGRFGSSKGDGRLTRHITRGSSSCPFIPEVTEMDTDVELVLIALKQWRGIAMRSTKSARNYHAGLCLAAMLHWLTSS